MQQVVKAISNLLLIIIFIIITSMLFKYASINFNKHTALVQNNGKYDRGLDETARGVWCVVLAICGCVGLANVCILFAIHYTDIVSGFVNPEYGAMKDILEFVSSKK